MSRRQHQDLEPGRLVHLGGGAPRTPVGREILLELGVWVVALLCAVALMLAFGIDHAGRLPVNDSPLVEEPEPFCEVCDDADPDCQRRFVAEEGYR